MSIKRSHGVITPVCNRQHVVPRFIVSGFNDDDNSAWINTMDGLIIHSGASGKYYWENNIYGKDLDDSWRGYEGFASNVIGTIRAGGNSINGKSYWFSLKPYIAGLVARDRFAHYEFSRTEWYRCCYQLDPDATRIMIFAATLTALSTASIAIMRTNRNFILNDSGYAWDADDDKLLIPISSNAMLVVSWPDTSLNGKTLIQFRDNFTLRSVSRDAHIANNLISKQAHQVTASNRDDAINYAPLNVDHGFMRWLTEWLPMRAIWNWTYPIAYLASSGEFDLDGASGPYDAIKAFGSQVTWRPPYLVLPDDDVLFDLIHGTDAGLIMDMEDVPWAPSSPVWIPRKDLPLS
jgi:hypothetical protein